jgi:DNA polymerase elongation subunit (family B)
MQQRIIEVLAEAHDYDGYRRKLDEARQILWRYEESLENGTVTLDDLIVSKRLTRAPRDYGKAGHSAIAAQQLYGSGVRLRPGQSVEYIITNSESRIPNDRVRAYAQWDGWHGYDRKKYAAMLREAFEPFERVRFGGMGPPYTTQPTFI